MVFQSKVVFTPTVIQNDGLKYCSRCFNVSLVCPSCVQVEEGSVKSVQRLTLTRDPAKYNPSSSGNSKKKLLAIGTVHGW